MADQLGDLEGFTASGECPPLVLRYFLSVFTQQHAVVKAVGEPLFREMRTVATVLDKLLQGDVTGGLDMLMQRFKACMVAVEEHGSWMTAQHLELIPPGVGAASVGPADMEIARSVALAELRLAKLKAELAG